MFSKLFLSLCTFLCLTLAFSQCNEIKPVLSRETILKRILSKDDTAQQKEAKVLVIKYIMDVANELESSKSKSSRTSLDDDPVMMDAIEAAIDYASRKSRQVVSELSSVSGSTVVSTEASTVAEFVPTTESAAETTSVRPTDKVQRQQSELMGQVNRLFENVQQGNVTGALNESLKIASVETIGVFINGLLNVLLCNPLDRWNNRCNDILTFPSYGSSTEAAISS